MLKGLIQSFEVVYFLHETEDPRKVGDAVESLLSTKTGPVSEVMQGHFGNKITRVRYHLTGAEAEVAFASVADRFSARLREELMGKMKDIIDDHSTLYLRFDKQRLVSGELAEGYEDPVRMRVRPRAFAVKGRAGEFYSELLAGRR